VVLTGSEKAFAGKSLIIKRHKRNWHASFTKRELTSKRWRTKNVCAYLCGLHLLTVIHAQSPKCTRTTSSKIGRLWQSCANPSSQPSAASL
jgi:hypothetical protein